MRTALGVGLMWLTTWAAWAADPAPKTPRKSVPTATVISSKPVCSGEYADDLSSLAPAIRELEHRPQSQYAYCVRNTAVYECLSYAQDGSVRRVRKKATSHGTAFGYRVQNGETLLLTNQHVAEMPAVTDEEHPVDDVPVGCKRVSDSLRIVENQSDDYERDDIPLNRVVTDTQLDVAVLKARQTLQILPWKIGHSSGLRERNMVDVRGFPLGAFQATNVGKVISAYDHDEYKEWDHDDFVIDALLSPGNSGSPVLALSCKTGEFELVGIYHAGYTNGSALNVVVGIDQVRDVMTTLKRTPRAKPEASAPDAQARTRLTDAIHASHEPFFAFGSLTAAARPRADGALIYEVYGREFPLKSHPVAVLEDLPPLGSDAFGELGHVWFGSVAGLKGYVRSELDADAQAQVARLLELLRHDAVTAFDYRTAVKQGQMTRERFEQVGRLERSLKRGVTTQHDASQAAADLADRLAPHSGDTAVAVTDIYSAPAVSRALPATLDSPSMPVAR